MINDYTAAFVYMKSSRWTIMEISEALLSPSCPLRHLGLGAWRYPKFIIHQMFSLGRDWPKRVT